MSKRFDYIAVHLRTDRKFNRWVETHSEAEFYKLLANWNYQGACWEHPVWVYYPTYPPDVRGSVIKQSKDEV